MTQYTTDRQIIALRRNHAASVAIWKGIALLMLVLALCLLIGWQDATLFAGVR